MFKKWFNRLAHIASSTFGSAKEDGFSLETSLTKFERFFHFWVLVCRSFVRNRCPVRASALSYTTLLALIPMLAVAMSVTSVLLKSEGEASIKQFIERFVDHVIPSVPAKHPTESASAVTDLSTADPLVRLANIATEASNQLDAIQFDAGTLRAALVGTNQSLEVGSTEMDLSPATNSIAQTHAAAASNHVDAVMTAGVVQAKKNLAQDATNYIYDFAQKSYTGTLGFTGMFFLTLTAILTLTRVEETFNDIWGVTRGRDWWSRIANYFITIVLAPALIVFALGLANGPNFQKTRELIAVVPFLKPLFATYLPLLVICFTFAMLYKLVPNTRVDFAAAFVGGSLAGIAWNCYNHLGFLLASSFLKTNAIYGSLAIVPLLMGGLYVVWLTVLFGAQVAYAYQNRESYLQDRLVENVNQRGREFVALRLMTCIGQRFHRGLSPATIREISVELGIPSKLVQQVMRTLLAAHLVVEVSGAEAGYSPARPLETINCHHILVAMRATHGQEPATRDEPVRIEVLGEFARIQAAEEQAAATVTMLALVNRAQARLELAAPPEPGKPINVAANVTAVAAPMFVSAAVASEPPPRVEPVVATLAPIALPEQQLMEAESAPAVSFAVATEATRPNPARQTAISLSPIAPTASASTDENQIFPL